MRQIYPPSAAEPQIAIVERGETGPAAEAAIARLGELYAYPASSTAGPGQSWVRANMITTVDGASTVNGLSGGMSGPADRLVFSVLRSLADVILVGAGTARAEKYRPVRASELWPQLRAGRPPTPPIAVVTTKLDLDLDSPLLAGAPPDARTIVLTTDQCPDERRDAAASADVAVVGADRVTPAGMIDALAERGYRRILVEGGPSLLGQITAAGLLNELCLTFSPLLEGGRAGRILTAPYEASAAQEHHGGAGAWPPAGLTLANVLEDNGFLLCRYLAGQSAVQISRSA
jgi:riboflavin biosynthesis pyrimidine reductase